MYKAPHKIYGGTIELKCKAINCTHILSPFSASVIFQSNRCTSLIKHQLPPHPNRNYHHFQQLAYLKNWINQKLLVKYKV
jgi:hypothetical protein